MVGALPSDPSFLEVPVGIPNSLSMPTFPGSCLACPCFFHLGFSRWALLLLRLVYLRSSPSAGVLKQLVHCSGVSELLTPDREVFDVTSGRFLTTGSSLP